MVVVANAILSVPLPVEVRAEMDAHKEIKWVEVARQAIIRQLEVLEKMDELLSKSDFSEQDALSHGKAVNKKVWARHKRVA